MKFRMNNNLRELVANAGAYTDVSGRWISSTGLQKFAEAIVRECEQVSLKNSHRDDDMGAIIARQIKEHFGVEE
jgi:hypothetical protein